MVKDTELETEIQGDTEIPDTDKENESENDDFDYDDVEENDTNLEETIVGDDTIEDDEYNFGPKHIIVSKEERISRPFMTKYELVRIIGTRRKQLSLGAKPMVKINGKLSINEIVNEEIKAKTIPFKIKRPYIEPNKYEVWDFDELDFSHLQTE